MHLRAAVDFPCKLCYNEISHRKGDKMKERNYGIELLRLVLMFMVCMLHILGQGGVLNAYEAGTAQYKLFYLLATIAYPAVDAFALITGYYAKDRPPKYQRLLDLWLQVFFYSCFVTLFFVLTGIAEPLDFEILLESLFPITSNQYWYFSCYFGAFFFFYPARLLVAQLSETSAKKLLTVMFVLFSLMGLTQDTFRLNKGYSMAWLIVLYTAGLLARKCRIFEKTKTRKLVCICILCVVITWLMLVTTDRTMLLNYTSPTIAVCGLLLVILFSRCKLNGKVIGKLSPCAFGIYLFQLNPIVWNNLQGAAVERLSPDIGMALLQIMAFSAILFLCGLAVDFIRQRLFDLLRIPKATKWFYEEASKLFDKRLTHS